jgi:hypothetical protein
MSYDYSKRHSVPFDPLQDLLTAHTISFSETLLKDASFKHHLTIWQNAARKADHFIQNRYLNYSLKEAFNALAQSQNIIINTSKLIVNTGFALKDEQKKHFDRAKRLAMYAQQKITQYKRFKWLYALFGASVDKDVLNLLDGYAYLLETTIGHVRKQCT